MKANLVKETGIYIVYPLSKKFQSIYKVKNYTTEVNTCHTKVGISESGFGAREKNYIKNFGSVDFQPIAIVDKIYLKDIEKDILAELKKHFNRSGKSREWFDTQDRNRIRKIILKVLDYSDIPYAII